MALLVGPANLGGARRIDLVGTGVLVMASFVWACASLWSKQRAVPASPLLVVAMQSLAGGAALWIAAIFSGELRALHFAAISGRSWMALIYLVVFGSGMGFTAYLYILKHSTAPKVATYAFVNPVVALLLGWMLAGETITARTAIAAAVILTAVVLVITTPRAEAAKRGSLSGSLRILVCREFIEGVQRNTGHQTPELMQPQGTLAGARLAGPASNPQ
jgi:drug/metabolite transporter (DMT)-like permease